MHHRKASSSAPSCSRRRHSNTAHGGAVVFEHRHARGQLTQLRGEHLTAGGGGREGVQNQGLGFRKTPQLQHEQLMVAETRAL